MRPLEQQFDSLLERRRAGSLLRQLTIPSSRAIDFSSNSYLSLSINPVITQSYLDLLTTHQDKALIGSGGSRLLDGNSAFTEQLEHEIARHHRAEAGLIFNSGFDANCGIFSCVAQKGDVVVYDELIHASVHDGMKMSRAAHRIPFSHNLVEAASKKDPHSRALKDVIEGLGEDALKGQCNVFIAVEGIYSMDGDVCPLVDVVNCVERCLPRGNGYIIVDEAHSTGIVGLDGRGLVGHLGLEDKIFLRLHTFGKAMSCSGAAVLCSTITRSYLINYSRSFIYTTAPSLAFLLAIKAGYDFLVSGKAQALINHVQELMAFTHGQLTMLNNRLHPPSDIISISRSSPESPIIPVITPAPRRLAKFCQDQGYMVRPIVAPTVPSGKERIRICLHAGNSFEEVTGLVGVIEAWVKSEMKANTLAKL
ncbi:hypothetical protein Cpir12675_000960 [Ceratocystis pirilliformis]|uniref:Aminotransferase class I/classII large domain-containing protein n=1 Tax=Ceratocystis pirilliformis TaxID=259994 RepID=A0ABR3ZI37_9PEZI